jgi:hypothetical protein
MLYSWNSNVARIAPRSVLASAWATSVSRHAAASAPGRRCAVPPRISTAASRSLSEASAKSLAPCAMILPMASANLPASSSAPHSAASLSDESPIRPLTSVATDTTGSSSPVSTSTQVDIVSFRFRARVRREPWGQTRDVSL